MKCGAGARKRQQTVSAKAHVRSADLRQSQTACRSQNAMHVQKASMEYLLLRKVA